MDILLVTEDLNKATKWSLSLSIWQSHGRDSNQLDKVLRARAIYSQVLGEPNILLCRRRKLAMTSVGGLGGSTETRRERG